MFASNANMIWHRFRELIRRKEHFLQVLKMQDHLLVHFARALVRSSICSSCQRPAISKQKALITIESSNVLLLSYSTSQTRHASSSRTADNDKYLPKPLDRLLGFRTPPEAGQNTGIDSRPWRERRDDLFNYDKHLVRRKELYVGLGLLLHESFSYITDTRLFQER